MINRFLVLVLLMTLLVGASGAAAAQEGNRSATESVDNESMTEGCKVLDGNVYLCSKSLEDGTAVLEFYATEDTSIKLGDAGVYLTGGQMTVEQFELNGGRKETVEFDVSVKNGKSAVGIRTPEGEFGEPLDSGWWKPSLPGEPTSADWAVAAGTALVVATGVAAGCTWWFRKGRGGAVRVF